jgi:predicted  nucleic acid-binding Zn-ribbon protein
MITGSDVVMDIGVLRGQLEREIAAADEAIRGRETQIEALKHENEEAVARIEHAREALARAAGN